MKQLLLSVLLLLPMVAYADVVEIDGIYYNLIQKTRTAEVTSNPFSYSGEVVIPEKVEKDGIEYEVNKIGDFAFNDCYIYEISIPNTVTSIGDFAFMGCKRLESISIPQSVSVIGWYAFCDCTSLVSIEIPYGVTSIAGIFTNCSSLVSVSIPNSVTDISYAFGGCSSLSSITIPNSVTTIGEQTFNSCSGLTAVTIPNSVTSISEGAFRYCSGLTSITIPNSVTSIGNGAFRYCSGLTSVTIPNSVLTIGSFVFSGCSGLTSVTIPNSINIIPDYAFFDCGSLTSITIGNGVKRIGTWAFSSCKELTDVCCYTLDVPDTKSDAFVDSYIEYATLHVPAKAISAYMETEPWNMFMSIEKIPLPEYTLTYMVDGIEYITFKVEEGTTIMPETEPTKEGYTFSGWSEIPETMPAHDVTVTGVFSINKYNLTYIVDGEEYSSSEIEYDASITPAEEPTKEGYTFSGWSEMPETMPAHDVTVTGVFCINKYNLTYTVDGEEYSSSEIEYDTNITPAEEPTKEGYTFSGWSEIPETMPAHDVTVTGSFSVNSYKLTYMVDNEVYKEIVYEYGATIVPEPQPDGNYATFEWEDLPETMPAHDVVIHASYTTGIIDVLKNSQNNVRIYTPDGKKRNQLQKGLNIVMLNDGTIHKIVTK